MTDKDPVSFPGEGPHKFPGVEAAEKGEDFFTSDCEYGCGAWLSGFSSAPPHIRRNKKYMSAYGDSRGIGTCPNNPENPND